MMHPLILDLAADGVPVTVTSQGLGFSTQAFYKWHKAPVSQRDWDDAHLINAARGIHADDPAATGSLPTNFPGADHRRREPCRTAVPQEWIWPIFAGRRGLNRRSGPPVHDDLVKRRFSA
ncbi:hypothetical protein MPRF_56730 [Mycolicibacterium parafortuitum]|uniref:Uncharacterized protein n=1 Tax=Mycolicibacterium parafortuitum TaxID=39692 RepID=A0A7I7UBG6_MYCPF|nr:hypothetical protein MPRF_56730 [Mycolicibacterium parafortuitum]